MNVAADFRTLVNLVARPVRGATHSERLESFYRGQAHDYDRFRERLLHGRRELIGALPLAPGAAWLDLGAGTGSNLELAGDCVAGLRQVTLVDLSESLLNVARERIRSRNWSNVTVLNADVTTLRLDQPVDVVTFSYSLTMIPNWFLAVERACELLRPGGVLGVTDFYISRKHVAGNGRRHRWWTRTFWPTWFAFDNVFLNSDLLPLLQSRFETRHLVESSGRVPYLPLGRVPYFVFVGQKR